MDADLQRLLHAWLSGDTDDDAIAPLLERLEADDDFRKAFTDELAMLGQLKAVQSSEPRWLKLEDALAATLDRASTDDCFEARVMDGLADSNTIQRPDNANLRWLSVLAGLAVAAVFVAILVWPRGRVDGESVTRDRLAGNRDRQDQSKLQRSGNDDVVAPERNRMAENAIAVLSQSVDVQWSGEQQPATGDSLEPGNFVLRRGTVQIEFLAGVRLLIRAPADFELRAAEEVLIRQGTASCFVTEMGRGFRIVTSEMEVIDLGTAFSIEVKQGKQPEVHVLEGSVEIKSGQRDTLELQELNAIRMGAGGPENVAYAPQRFPQTSDLRNQQRIRAEQRFQAWREHSAKLSSDPAVLLHYDFEESDPSALELTNRAADASQATDGVVIGCQWSEGRWPSKRALVYRNASDRVLFQVPGAFDELTLMVWARIDALTQRTTSLLMTENPIRRQRFAPANDQSILDARKRLAGSKVKTVRWELAQHNSNVMFSVGHGGDAPWQYDACEVDHPFTRSDRWGDRACLAVTCDVARREVIHYLNGEPIGAGNSVYAEPLLLDFMELGNFGASSEELNESAGFAQRRFYGAIDEVVIASRVFDAAEIKSFWSTGKP